MTQFLFQYSCVHPRDLKELQYIIDHRREITYRTFLRHVGNNLVKEWNRWLGYENIPCLSLKKDSCVHYYRSRLPNGKAVYYFVHSAIEYIFYE